MGSVMWYVAGIGLWIGGAPASSFAQERGARLYERRDVGIEQASHDGRRQVIHPVGAALLADGTIAIADAATARVLFFSSDGILRRTAGGRGRGEGRLGAISWLGHCGPHSVIAFDFINQVALAFDARGRLLRQRPLKGDPAVLACSQAGRLAFISRPLALPRRVVHPGSVIGSLFLVDSGWTSVRRLQDIKLYDYDARLGPAQPRPLGMTTTLAVSRDEVVMATGRSDSVFAVDSSGKRRLAAIAPADTTSPARAQFNRAAAEMSLIAPDSQSMRMARSLLSRADLPRRLPRYHAVFSDRQGDVWLQLSQPGDSSTRLARYDRTGSLMATVVIRGDVTVFEVDAKYVLGSTWEHGVARRMEIFRPHR
jgi:hypothetical protein